MSYDLCFALRNRLNKYSLKHMKKDLYIWRRSVDSTGCLKEKIIR